MKIAFILFVIVLVHLPCFAEKYYCLEQQSIFSKKAKVFYNKNLLAINLPNLRLWYLAYHGNSNITTINLQEKLYFTTSYDLFHGNAAQGIGTNSIRDIETTSWKPIVDCHKKGLNCVEVDKIAINNKQKPKSGQFFMNYISINNIHFKKLVAIVSLDMYLSSNQSALVSDIYGLEGLIKMPIEAYMIQEDNNSKFVLTTSSVKPIDCSLQNIFNLNNYKKAHAINEIYYSKAKVDDAMKDFLDLKNK